MKKPTGIQLAIEAAGSQANLARLLKRSPQIVSYWARTSGVPVKHLAEVERVTRVPRTKLRPDIYQ